jgi:hypothetical protein
VTTVRGGGPGGASAGTSPEAADHDLRGRTYAIPFERVWQAARSLAGGGLWRWRLVDEDDHDGILHAEVDSWILAPALVVTIVIGLDENGQTRVDAAATPRTARRDLGACRRAVLRFCRRLDRAVGA